MTPVTSRRPPSCRRSPLRQFRTLPRVLLSAALGIAVLVGPALLGATHRFAAPLAHAQDTGPGAGTVSAGSGLVVHGVDNQVLAARFRQVDRKLADGGDEGVSRDLAELLSGNLDALIEESEGVYLHAREAALLRVATLPEPILEAYQDLVAPSAKGALEEGLASLDAGRLEDAAYPRAFARSGPRLFVLLADLRLARGELAGATRVLEDLLRYWPDEGRTAQMPGVDRADVVSRLAGLLRSADDPSGLRRLREVTSPAVLALPSPAGVGASLEAELLTAETQCQKAAARRALPPGARLEVAGEVQWLIPNRASPSSAVLGLYQPLPVVGREIPQHGVALEGPNGPLLVTREGRAGSPAPGKHTQLIALGPPRPGARPLGDDLPPELAVLWAWPPTAHVRAGLRAGGLEPFRPAVVDDLLIFPWPSDRLPSSELGPLISEQVRLNDLVVLSLRREGAEADIRGTGEGERADGDAVIASLSFCGEPLVDGRTIYATLVGYAAGGQHTELHVARFDLEPHGRSHRLWLRWRRKVVNGSQPAEARYSTDESGVELPSMVLPTGLAIRSGQLYVGSNTGAVACLDTRTGRVDWLQVYERIGSERMTIRQNQRSALRESERYDIVTWKDGPVRVDGPTVYVTPRDSEQLLVYHHRPLRADRSMLIDALDVRGGATLWSLRPEELVAVRDGVAYFSGHVAVPRPGELPTPSSALVAYRLRERRPGDPERPDALAQTPEPATSGSPTVAAGDILLPTWKGIYRIPLEDVGAALDPLFAPGFPPEREWVPDRIGNLIVQGTNVWSITPSRVVLFRAK